MNREPDSAAPGGLAPPGRAAPMQRIFNVLAAIGTVWIFLLMLLVVADVVGRNFLDKPITGVAEFAARSVSAIVFLQLAAAVGAGKMTKSDFLQRMLLRWSPWSVAIMDALSAVLGAVLFVALAWISWPELLAAWKGDEYFGVQGVYMIATWPFRALVVVGSVTAALAYLLSIPQLFREPAGQPEVAL